MRGGARQGAGRKKKEGQTVFYVRCTEEEKEKLKKFLEELRGK